MFSILSRLAGSSPNKALKGHKLLIISPWTPPTDVLTRLREVYSGLEIAHYNAKSDVPDGDWSSVTILLTQREFPTKEAVPKLEYIQLYSAGAEHIVKDPLFVDTDISFCTANGVHGPQITEWIIGTFLAFQHSFPAYLEHQREGKWKRLDTPVDDAVGQRVGILGYGSIGRQVARVAKALGADVHAYTLHPRKTPESRRDDGYTPPGLGDPEGVFPSKWFSGESKEELHEFLGSGLDLLVVSLPLTDLTRNLLSASAFEVLSKSRTFVSNIGRGPIINTTDLIEALDKGVIRGAAIDVTDPEPLPDGHPLFKAKNIIITPHVSGASSSYNTRVLAILEHNLSRLSEGMELTNKVSRKDGY